MQNLLLFGGWQYPGDWAKSWKQWDSTRFVFFFFGLECEKWVVITVKKNVNLIFVIFYSQKEHWFVVIAFHYLHLMMKSFTLWRTLMLVRKSRFTPAHLRSLWVYQDITENTTSSIVIKTSHFLYELVVISPLLFQLFISHGLQVQNQADKWWG